MSALIVSDNIRKHNMLGLLAVSVLVLLVMAAPSFAAKVIDDISGSADISFLERFPHSRIIRYQQEKNTDYLLALGKLKRVDGVWRAEEERELQGSLTSLTYRAAEDQSAKGVYAHFVKQFEAQAIDPLYSCKGLACGNSNKWANTVFSEKRLYGPNSQQYYYAGRKGDIYLALYVIKRGNKRVYARLDVISAPLAGQGELPATQDSTLAQSTSYSDFKNSKHIVLESLQRTQSRLFPVVQERFLKELVAGLIEGGASLRIVAHNYGSETVAELIEQSKKDAEFMVNYLVEQGVPVAQLEYFGVGPLAPKPGVSPSAASPRLELFITSD